MKQEYRIYGPPGTGKTTWIINHANEMATEFGADQISICSLTRAAIHKVAGRDILVDTDNIATLHARCKRSLQAPAPAEARVNEFIEKYPAWASAKYLPKNLSNRSFKVQSEMSIYERAQVLRQQMVPKKLWPLNIKKWHDVWDKWCMDEGIMDFTGWLENELEIGSLPPQQAVFVDEAQDHTTLQLEVIRSWNTKELYLIGDDDQNLYEWAGASPQAFISGSINSPETVLKQSYRVPRRVHNTAMKIINQVSNRKYKDYLPTGDNGNVQTLMYSLNDAKYGNKVPPHILEDDNQTYMIITAANYMLNPIIEVLINYGIPFYNPYRPLNVKWNPLNAYYHQLIEYLDGRNHAIWGKLLNDKAYKSGKKRDFIEESKKYKIPDEDIPRYFNDYTADLILKRNLNIFKEYNPGRELQILNYTIKVLEQPVHKQQPRVIIGTIHSIKGGEADNVYLFPDISRSAGYSLMINKNAIYRMFYVGITRAKKSLYICSPSGKYWVDIKK